MNGNNEYPKEVHGVKLHTFTFKDSGVTVAYRKLSPNTIIEFNRWFEQNNLEPKPPIQKVVYADGREIEEPNESHPDYVDALRQYSIKKKDAMQRLFIRRSIVIELNPEQAKAVDDLREFWSDEYGEDLEGNDKEVFINHIACSTPEDLKDLIRAISHRSIPTEDAISETSKSL